MKKIRIALFCITLLGFSMAQQVAAQLPANTLVSSFQNLTRPGTPALETRKTDEIEIVWKLNPDAKENGFPGTPIKIECSDIQLLAQLELGAPTPIAKLHTSNEAQTVRVRFRPADYEYLLPYYKANLQQFESQFALYVKFGDIVMYSDPKQTMKATIADRQRWIRIILS